MEIIKKYWKPILAILTVAYLVWSISLISASKKHSIKAQNEKNKIAEILNFNDRLLNFQEWVSEAEWERKNKKYNDVLQAADEHNTKALNAGYALIYISLVFGVLVLLLLFRIKPFFGLAFSLSLIALTLLLEGVLNPMLEVGAFKKNLTVKAKVKPIETPAYDYGMITVDSMDNRLNSMVDSLDTKIISITNEIHEKSKDAQAKLNTLKSFSSKIPFYGADFTKKINAMSSVIDPLTEITHPLNDHLLQVKALKNIVLDTLKSVANSYADTTYGIDKVFPGRTYFYYQNKGVFDIMNILFKSKNYIVGVCIGLFSFLIPCIKLGASLFMLLFPAFSSKRTQTMLSFISKWSMADVYVVGAFLSYLSFSNMNPGVDVEANVLFGLYFFLSYVIISVFLGELLKRSIKESSLTE
ncbi:MAG: paraquat-inducible protein A [Crocinitomicaceae bacterium]|nr:paraquat-inducible protein A [Crocinitomicaceae bacterium]